MSNFANFENFQLLPNSELNNRESHKISSGKRALLQKLSAKKLISSGKRVLLQKLSARNLIGGGGGDINSAFMAN